MDSSEGDDVEIAEDVPPIYIGIHILYVFLFAIGVVWCVVDDRDLIGSLAPGELASELGLAILAGLASVAGVGLFWKHTTYFRAIEGALAERLGDLRTGGVLALAASSSIAEEVFFRGALQSWLIERSGSLAIGYCVTSLVFGLLHTGPSRAFLAWTAFAVGAGFALGGAYLATGNIVVPILIHGIINAVNMQMIMDRARRRRAATTT